MSRDRVITTALAAGVIVALVGGALLLAKVLIVAQTNSRFICAFGHAIAAQPIKQQAAETNAEFRLRVEGTQNFVNDIAQDLDDCEGPTALRVSPEAQRILEQARERERAKTESSTAATPSPIEPEGVVPGGGKNPSGKPGPGEGPPANPAPQNPAPSPQPQPKLLEPVCDLTDSLGLPLC